MMSEGMTSASTTLTGFEKSCRQRNRPWGLSHPNCQ